MRIFLFCGAESRIRSRVTKYFGANTPKYKVLATPSRCRKATCSDLRTQTRVKQFTRSLTPIRYALVPRAGFEPATPSSSGKCSTN